MCAYRIERDTLGQAVATGRPIKEVAAAQTDLSAAELERLLDPRRMLAGGVGQG